MDNYDLLADINKVLEIATEEQPLISLTIQELRQLYNLAIEGAIFKVATEHATSKPGYEGYMASNGWVLLGKDYFDALTKSDEYLQYALKDYERYNKNWILVSDIILEAHREPK